MPNGGLLYANDFVDALKKKHAAKSYKKMVSSMHHDLNILYIQSNHIKVSLFRLTPKTSFLGEIVLIKKVEDY